MKRRELMCRISAITLSCMLAGNFLVSASPIDVDSLPSIANMIEADRGIEPFQSIAYSQIGGIESFSTKDNVVTIKMTTGEQVRVSLLGDKVFCIYIDPTGEFKEDPAPNDQIHITTIREKADSEYKGYVPNIEDGDFLKISTNSLTLEIEKATGKMELKNKENNETIWKEAEPLKYNDNETVQTLETNDEEYFYGGGMQNGRFSHKGKSINIRNENIWTDDGVTSPNPFYFSTNGYGVMRDTFKPGKYDFGSVEKEKVVTKHSEKRFDAYYFIDDKPNEILKSLIKYNKTILISGWFLY